MDSSSRLLRISAFLALLSASATSAHVVRGRVLRNDGTPLPSSNVVLVENGLGAVVDEQGAFVIRDVPEGQFTLEASHVGYATMRSIIMARAHELGIDICLQETILRLPGTTVSASSLPMDVLVSTRSVSLVEGSTLERKRGASLGKTVESVPGVRLLSLGPGINKPVIRGMTNQRIVVYMDGLRMEGQSWGSHHSPEVDPLAAARVEVLRGPAGLLYGADALGGVVHIVSPRIRTTRDGVPPLAGTLAFEAGTNASDWGGVLSLGGATDSWSWNFGGGGRKRGNYSVPGANTFLDEVRSTEHERASLFGSVSFSAEKHEARLRATQDWEEQVVIGDGHWHSTGGGSDGTEPWFHAGGSVIAPRSHTLVDWAGRWRRGAQQVEYDIGAQRDILQEGAGDINIEARSGATRLRWHHLLLPTSPGTLGFSLQHKRNRTRGSEALLPNYNTTDLGIYLEQSLYWRDLHLSAGLRADQRWLRILETARPGGSDVSAQTINETPIASGSVGLSWRPGQGSFSLATNLGSGWRAPSPSELFANGVHHGEWRYELGNPDLEAESALNADFIGRWISPQLVGELSVFRNQIDRYIFANPSGRTDAPTGIPIYTLDQRDALFTGLELHLQWEARRWLSLEAGLDLVRGEVRGAVLDADGDGKVEDHLPRIPPARWRGGAHLEGCPLHYLGVWHLDVDLEHVAAQHNLAEFENLHDEGKIFIAPQPHTLVHLGIEKQFQPASTRVRLEARNLLNENYFDHLSLYKGIAHDPGFDLRLRVSLGGVKGQ